MTKLYYFIQSSNRTKLEREKWIPIDIATERKLLQMPEADLGETPWVGSFSIDKPKENKYNLKNMNQARFGE